MADVVDLPAPPDPANPWEEQAFAVLHQLRTDLTPEQWAMVRTDPVGARPTVSVVVDGDAVTAVASWRVNATTSAGRMLYVDDLVTDAAVRSRGHGELLLAYLRGKAEAFACSRLELDSGVQRFDAHRFYLRERMHITAHHFGINV